ncbi:MAG: hypothetical protein V5A88_05890 [Candidatus Thermoplasmatota archaeon]
MDVEKLRPQMIEELFSKANIKITLISSILIGFVFLGLGVVGPDRLGFHFFTALGASLVVGTIFGSWAGIKLGWPMGLLGGMIIGLILSPLISARLKGALAAYFATFLSPVIGGFIGRGTELRDKKSIEKNIIEKKTPYNLKTLDKKK